MCKYNFMGTIMSRVSYSLSEFALAVRIQCSNSAVHCFVLMKFIQFDVEQGERSAGNLYFS